MCLQEKLLPVAQGWLPEALQQQLRRGGGEGEQEQPEGAGAREPRQDRQLPRLHDRWENFDRIKRIEFNVTL